MRIEFVYENRYLIPEEYENNFLSHRKNELNTVEHIGLETIALEFFCCYEEEVCGEPVSAERRQNLRDCLYWNESSITILDGCYNTYEFDGYLFKSVWMTDSGIPMLTVYEIPEGCEDWTEEDYADFDERIFRLN